MRFFLLASLFLTGLFSACGDESTLADDATVAGNWELKRAMRNNMETATLDGLYFEFNDDGSLVTNLMSEEATTGKYVWEASQITTEGVSLPLTYTITELTDSTLNLQSKYQGYQFNFELTRQE